MDRISINLLPIDLKDNKKNLKKKRLLNTLSISLLGVLIIITGILVVLSLIQNKQLNSEKEALSSMGNTITSLKQKEAAVVILKKRLANVSEIMNEKYPQTDSFLLVTSLIPEDVYMQTFSTNQKNSVALQGTSNDASSLQKFFDNLTDPKINEGKIIKTVISNLNRGSTPKLGFDLEITTKLGATAK